ncbi:MAG: type IV secretory system conjugative DNA transfer family protein [Candidatus Paceibacterota bacterium]|jgi:hypothetical protein
MEKITSSETPQFSSPHEELAYLREQVIKKEREVSRTGVEPEREHLIREQIHEYNKTSHDVLKEEYRMTEKHRDAIVLNLSPEQHDHKMAELLALLQEKGIKNTLSVVEKMNDPHLEDDFHRFLVQYIKQGYAVGLKEKDPVFKALRMTLYEVALPEKTGGAEEKQKTLKEIVSSMEQFYAGMLSVSDKKSFDRYIALELANANHSNESIFFVSVPDDKKALFEKHILSVFPRAKLSERPDDYNVFNEAGVSVGSYALIEKNPIFSLKTYEKFDTDPMNVIQNTFSKIDKDDEGAAIQIIFRPCGDSYIKSYKNALEQIKKDVPLKDAIDIPNSLVGEFWKVGRDLFKASTTPAPEKDKPKEKKPVDEEAVKSIQEKVSSPIVECCIRIVASSKTEQEATTILSDLESSFNQFENTGYSHFAFKRVKKSGLSDFLKHFSFRDFSTKHTFPINLKELTTVMHFHEDAILSAPMHKHSKAGTAPAPLGLVSEGILLGVNRDRNTETKVFMSREDRLRHCYVIGQTGTGKTTLLKNMVVQDIINGDGVCMIDPHGTDILDILASIPKERYDDVIYFDPSYVDRPMALNMLEYDVTHPEQKTFVVNEMLAIFNKLFDMKTAGGPMFEQYFRNATMLVIEDPETGCTLLDVSRVLSDKTYRQLKLSRCKNPVVVQFWREVADKAGGEASLANIVPYITSKFDVFLSNEIMRPIVAQEHSSFNFRKVMDEKKILLVNLAKGRLGDLNANLIGLIIVGKILMATLSRVDVYGTEIPDFYLYIDEFQNVTTDSISTILSEARKYKLGLTVAHQFIAQLEEDIKDSVFGNVGTIASFRVGSDDAEYLEKQFSPVFTAADLMNVDNRNAYIKMLAHGKPLKPFNIETMAPPARNASIIDDLKQLSYLKYGRPKDEVEGEIMTRYAKPPVVGEGVIK